MSRYKYDDNLEDSIFKVSLILNLQSNMLQKENLSELEKYEEGLPEIEISIDEENTIDEILQLALPLEK